MESAAPPRILSTQEADMRMMLASEVHLGTKSVDFQMQRYVFKRRSDGYLLNLFHFMSLSVSSLLHMHMYVIVLPIVFDSVFFFFFAI